tara:strand:- start:332 stop:1552 length:1221 start_codon:yes stop_codon:yes gene_type:complete
MKILFITDNFPPERNAPAKRTFEHTKEWVKSGHDVTVITGAPNFPIGKVFDGYKNRIYQKESMGKINIKRVWTYIAENKGFMLRILDYISFMVSSCICGIFTKKHDMVIATSPQFFTAISGYLISVIKRSNYVLEIRDLWPESIVTVGAMKESSLIIKILSKIALFLYVRAKIIVCVTDSFKQDLINKGIDSDKIIVIKNGFDFDNILTPTKTISQLEDQYNLNSDDFIVSFIGTIGMAHGLDVILEASKNIDKKVKFLIVGDGAEKDILKQKAQNNSIDNVIFISSISWQEIINLNQIISVNLVHLIDSPEFRKVIPSKIFESMALKKPIIMGVLGEANKIVQDAKCGIEMIPENPNSLNKAINNFLDNSQLLHDLSNNGYKYVFKNYNRTSFANQMIEYIRIKL